MSNRNVLKQTKTMKSYEKEDKNTYLEGENNICLD